MKRSNPNTNNYHAAKAPVTPSRQIIGRPSQPPSLRVERWARPTRGPVMVLFPVVANPPNNPNPEPLSLIAPGR
jgi:hypothetical protein